MNSVRMVARNVRSGVRSMSTNSATKKGPYSNDQWLNLKHGASLPNQKPKSLQRM